MFCPAIPITRREAIDSPPSEVAVQPGPSPPSARLKPSDPITVSPLPRPPPPPLEAQVTATLVTLAEAMVPEPLATVQVRPAGLVCTVTLYAAPLASWVPKANKPFALTLSVPVPLSCSTTVPDNPDTIPPTEYVVLEQARSPAISKLTTSAAHRNLARGEIAILRVMSVPSPGVRRLIHVRKFDLYRFMANDFSWPCG